MSSMKLPPISVKNGPTRSRSISADNAIENQPDETTPVVNNVENNAEPLVVAREGLQVVSPWVVVESKAHRGRYFFFNTRTKKSAWEIESCFIVPQVSSTSVGDDIRRRTRSSSTLSSNSSASFTDTMSPSSPSGSHGFGSNSVPTIEEQQNYDSKLKEEAIAEMRRASSSNVIGGSIDSKGLPSVTHRESFVASIRKSMRSSLSLLGGGGSSKEGGAADDEMSVGSSQSGRKRSSRRDRKSKSKEKSMVSSVPELPDVLLKKDRQPVFRVIDGLGMGGFSIVLKVQDIKTYKTFAMKKISKAKSSMTWQSRLQQKLEIEIMKQMPASPFIQTCDHVFEDSKFIYMILEELRGDLFYHFSSRMGATNNFHAFSESECKILLAELYLAIEHIHNHGVVHRDIKLENVMLTQEGHLKLVDFGLALRIEADTQPMFPSGSISLMPPELIKYHTGGRHTDWWAYGVLAHELLTGHTPWSSLTDNRIISNEILNNRVAPPFETDVSDVASDFVCGLLHPDFRERLGTIPSSAVNKDTHKNNIRNSMFFKSINWPLFLYNKNVPAFYPKEEVIYESDRQKIFEEHKASHCSMILEDTNFIDEDFDDGAEEGEGGEGGGGNKGEPQHGRESALSGSFDDSESVAASHVSSSTMDIKTNGWNLGYPSASKYLLI